MHMNANHHVIEEPPFAKALLENPKSAWLWLIVRLYVGWQWLSAGWEKVHSPVWVGKGAGAALNGFVNGALAKTAGAHPDVQGWYGWFLRTVIMHHPLLWSHLVAYGELLVGIALIIGLFTGIAAFFGLFMNFNYLLAGTVSTNPILLALGIALVLAWRVAGYFGVDHWLLPAIGTPWRSNTLPEGSQ